MKKNGFTLVELLAVIAILAILVIVAMPNVLGMFNEAKQNTFVTDVQKIMDTAKAEFMSDAFSNAGQTLYYSSKDNSLDSSKLNIETNKEYFIEMDRHGEFKRVVVYDDNFCYDIYADGTNANIGETNSKYIASKITNSIVKSEDILNLDNADISVFINDSNYIVKGCLFSENDVQDVNIDVDKVISGEILLTYGLFGAVGDGVTNDYLSIKNAHDFANKIYIEHDYLPTVYSDENKTYYLSTMNKPIDVITNVDFKNSKFIIDDYIDLNNDNVNDVNTVDVIFNVTNPIYIKTKNLRYLELKENLDSGFVVNKNSTNLSSIINALKNNLNYKNDDFIKKQFDGSRYWIVTLENSNRMYIRTGKNATSGHYQTDVIVIDSSTGNVVVGSTWNYDSLRSVKVYPMNTNNITIRNGEFVTRTNNVVYSSKNINDYSNRNLYVNYTGNVTIENIKHNIDENYHSYTGTYQSINGNLYFGFIKLNNTANVKINNVDLSSHTFTHIVDSFGNETTSGNGTYDLTINNSANVYINDLSYYCKNNDSVCYNSNIVDYTKWGIMNSNNSKNLFITNSKLNRIDAHRGVTNLYLKDSTIGSRGITLIGDGYFYGENVLFDRSTTMINLRQDYGSTFDGSIYLKNVNYKIGNNASPRYPNIIFSDNLENHYFGYKTYFPNVYIDGINIDTTYNNEIVYVSVLRLAKNPNSTADYSSIDKLYNFKSDFVLKNLSITNSMRISIFPDDFCNVSENLQLSTYGGNNAYNMNLDSKIHIHSKINQVTNSKFVFSSNNSLLSHGDVYSYLMNLYNKF